MTVKNTTYDRLKFAAVILLPSLGTLYFALGGIWHFPAVEQVVGTITAIDTALGAVVAKLSSSYSPETDGVINVNGLDENGIPQIALNVNHPDDWSGKNSINLKVESDLTHE